MTDRDPVERFVAMAAAHDRCFWLDGGGARPWSGRRSILGWLDDDDVSLTYDAARGEVVRHVGDTATVVGDDVFAALEAETAGDGEDVHWVGYLGYASRPDLPATRSTRRTRCRPRCGCAPPTCTSSSTRSAPRSRSASPTPDPTVEVPEEYAAAFADVQEQLRAGNSYEVNLTHRLTVPSDLDPVTAYLRLRALNPAPYAGFLQHRGRWLLSSSPERFATVDRHRRIETKPIKGTTPRGRTAADDARSRELLATDPKFRAENLMIVDLLRNDIATVGEVGSVEVPVLMDVESYPSVHQLVSTVRGVLRDEVTDGRRAAGALPGRLDDRCAQAAHDGGDPRRRGHRPRRLRGRVRLDLRRRPRRPGRGHPQPDHGRRRHLDDRHRRRRSRSAPTWPRSTPSPAGRPSGCCASST